MSGEGTGLKHGPWELAEERADSEGRTQREHVSYRKVATGWYTLQCGSPLGLHLEKLRDRAPGSRGAPSSFCLSRGVGTEASSTQTPDV